MDSRSNLGNSQPTAGRTTDTIDRANTPRLHPSGGGRDRVGY